MCWSKGETVAPGSLPSPGKPLEVTLLPRCPSLSPRTRAHPQPWTGPSRSWRWAPLRELGLLPQGWGFQGPRRVAGPVTGVRGLSMSTELPAGGCCWGSRRHLPVRVTARACVHMCGHVRRSRACGCEHAHTQLVCEWPGRPSSSGDPAPAPGRAGAGAVPRGSPMEALPSAFTPVSSRPPRCSPGSVLYTGAQTRSAPGARWSSV